MSTENLAFADAVKKLKALAEDIRFCMFATDLKQQPIPVRPMTVQEVDDEGNIWFISSADSSQNTDIQKDNKVQLFFQKSSSQEYLSVYGEAFIYTDRATIEDKWSAMANAWFENGAQDPNASILRIAPSSSYYWDTKAGALASFVYNATAALLGKKTDNADGVEGKLHV